MPWGGQGVEGRRRASYAEVRKKNGGAEVSGRKSLLNLGTKAGG